MIKSIDVMVNGLPGKMASKVAEYVNRSEDLALLPFSLTGPEIEQPEFDIGDIKIQLIRPLDRKDGLMDLNKYKNRKDAQLILEAQKHPDEHPEYPLRLPSSLIATDFTHPSAVNSNAEFYCDEMLDFVMGTTGGDRKLLEETVKKSNICAVIAPNMAKQIVAFQAMMQYAAETFPDVFKGYSLEIVESHQKGKADTSGTALAMVEKPDGTKGYFNLLGVPFKKEQIKMIRDPEEQLKMGIPQEYLSGHGWHTYTLKSEDGTVLFRFTHNVNGREIYATSTLDAIRYLDKKLHEGNKGKVYFMIDVLKGK